MKENVRIGLVGVGRGLGYGNIAYKDPRCLITALCDADEGALAVQEKELEVPASACYSDYETFLNEGTMDAVIIATPIPAHAEQTIMALEAGKHVLSEVTMSNTLDGCRKTVEAAKKAKGTYMLAENCIYWPFIQQWKQWIEKGLLGDIIYAESEYLHPIRELLIDPDTGKRTWRADRPPIHYCSHSLGPLLFLMEDRISRVTALGKGKKVLPDALPGGTDMQVALFETKKGKIIKLLRTQAAPRHPSMHYYTLQGSKGFVENDRVWEHTGHLYVEDEMEKAEKIECPDEEKDLPEEATAGGHGSADYALLQDFLDCVLEGKRPLLDEDMGWDITVPGLIAAQSAEQDGTWMDIPEYN
jgi:predicted dehydrogenase